MIVLTTRVSGAGGRKDLGHVSPGWRNGRGAWFRRHGVGLPRDHPADDRRDFRDAVGLAHEAGLGSLPAELRRQGARADQDVDARVSLLNEAGEVEAVQGPRHGHVGEHRVDVAPGSEERHRVIGGRRLDHLKAPASRASTVEARTWGSSSTTSTHIGNSEVQGRMDPRRQGGLRQGQDVPAPPPHGQADGRRVLRAPTFCRMALNDIGTGFPSTSR